MNKSKYIFLALLLLAFVMFAAEVFLNLREEFVSDRVQTIWILAFGLLTTLWARYDSKGENIDKPFQFSYLIYFFWPVAFPWYLLKTRGHEGILVFFGFVALGIGPWLSGVVAYFYFALGR